MNLKDILVLSEKINKASKNGNMRKVTLLIEQREKSINNIKNGNYEEIPNEKVIVKKIEEYDNESSLIIKKTLNDERKEMKVLRKNKNAYSKYKTTNTIARLDIKK